MGVVVWAVIPIPGLVLVGAFLEGIYCLVTGKEPFFADTTWHSE